MTPQLLDYVKQAHNKTQALQLLALGLDGSAAALAQAEQLAFDGGPADQIVRQLWKAVTELSRVSFRRDMANWTPVGDSLSEQLLDPSFSGATRRCVFEIALVMAADARAQTLRLIRELGLTSIEAHELSNRILCISALIKCPIAKGALPTLDSLTPAKDLATA